MPFFAHSKNSSGEKHDLVTHLRGVARFPSPCAWNYCVTDSGNGAGFRQAGRTIHSAFHVPLTCLNLSRESGKSIQSQRAVCAVGGGDRWQKMIRNRRRARGSKP